MVINVHRKLMDDLLAMAVEMGYSEGEAARDAVWQYFEAAGYTPDRIEAEFGAMDDEQILAVYYDLY